MMIRVGWSFWVSRRRRSKEPGLMFYSRLFTPSGFCMRSPVYTTTVFCRCYVRAWGETNSRSRICHGILSLDSSTPFPLTVTIRSPVDGNSIDGVFDKISAFGSLFTSMLVWT